MKLKGTRFDGESVEGNVSPNPWGRGVPADRLGPGTRSPALRVDADADRWRGSEAETRWAKCISISGLIAQNYAPRAEHSRC